MRLRILYYCTRSLTLHAPPVSILSMTLSTNQHVSFRCDTRRFNFVQYFHNDFKLLAYCSNCDIAEKIFTAYFSARKIALIVQCASTDMWRNVRNEKSGVCLPSLQSGQSLSKYHCNRCLRTFIHETTFRNYSCVY